MLAVHIKRSPTPAGSHVIEVEAAPAAIWKVDVGNGEPHIFASGLRNPNRMAWTLSRGALWRMSARP